jgi:hypothetical protein
VTRRVTIGARTGRTATRKWPALSALLVRAVTVRATQAAPNGDASPGAVAALSPGRARALSADAARKVRAARAAL